MDAKRFEEFVDRIATEINNVFDNHFRENPVQAHNFRVADCMSTVLAYRWCGNNQDHWECLFHTSNLTRYLYVLSALVPNVLDDIFADFREDLEKVLPNNIMEYNVVASREYPVPDACYHDGKGENHGGE